MGYNLTACVFIRDCFKGAFCLFESMHQLLPLVDKFIVMDLGSTDGTLEVLEDIARANSKIEVVHGEFYKIDANVFATLANDLVSMCQTENVLYYQSDEVWHEDLVELMRQKFEENIFDLTFWRIQYRENFQKVKWYPHPVHRVGKKNKFNFVGDGMNTDRQFEPEICSTWGMGWFQKWYTDFNHNPETLPTNEMILDVSLTGGFLENIPARRRMHLPFWNEGGDNMPSDEGGWGVDFWMGQQRRNENWYLTYTQFNIPAIMYYHLGKERYTLRPELVRALKRGITMPVTVEGGDWR